LRQRAEAPMAGAALSRQKSEYDKLNGSKVTILPTEDVSFQIDKIIVNSEEPRFKKYKNRLSAYEHQDFLFYKDIYKSRYYLMDI